MSASKQRSVWVQSCLVLAGCGLIFTIILWARELETVVHEHEKLIVVLATILIAGFTGSLWYATRGLFRAASEQAADTRKSLAIATDAALASRQSAEIALVSAMPVLSPRVGDMHRLHPFKTTILQENNGPPHVPVDSLVLFTFDNYGSTPALIRSVHADLFVTQNDVLPTSIDYDALPTHEYEVIIPAGVTGQGNGVTAMIDHSKSFQMSEAEFGELTAEAVPPFRRIVLIGRVVYDDFFRTRHTRTFCLKMRLVPKQVMSSEAGVFGGLQWIHAPFQVQTGGAPYNRITRQPAPEEHGV